MKIYSLYLDEAEQVVGYYSTFDNAKTAAEEWLNRPMSELKESSDNFVRQWLEPDGDVVEIETITLDTTHWN